MKDFDERTQKLLKLLIECYIRDGEPVGSKTLAAEKDVTISSASIRNIMADLEAAGFLHSPHTSAGRVPTIKGYRFFVDGLLNAGPAVDANGVTSCLQPCGSTKELVAEVSLLLSDMTKLASVVMLPKRDIAVLRHIEFLPLTQNRVLVVLVFNKYEVQNRIIYTERCYNAAELQQIGNFLTAEFAGKSFTDIKNDLVRELQQGQQYIEQMTKEVVSIAAQAFTTSPEADYVVSGETNLLEIVEPEAIDKLRSLFEAFAKKRDILYLLDQSLKADGIKIYIGEESGYAAFDDYSLVTMPYRERDQVVGVLGVIGPTRMPYERAIAAVDITAKLLSAALAELGPNSTFGD